MCGIVGYIGTRSATPILLDGLRRLEYRGYDSAGLVLNPSESNLWIRKTTGRVADLDRIVQDPPTSHMGIAHTRWATHGGVTDQNAHPHLSFDLFQFPPSVNLVQVFLPNEDQIHLSQDPWSQTHSVNFEIVVEWGKKAANAAWLVE